MFTKSNASSTTMVGKTEIEKGVTERQVFAIISSTANVAQWQSSGFVNRGLSVRIRPLAFLHFIPVFSAEIVFSRQG